MSLRVAGYTRWMDGGGGEEEEEREGRFVLLPHYVAEEDAALTKRGAPPMLQLRELPLSIIITAKLLLGCQSTTYFLFHNEQWV